MCVHFTISEQSLESSKHYFNDLKIKHSLCQAKIQPMSSSPPKKEAQIPNPFGGDI